MAQNPHPKRVRKALKAKGVAHEYLEYGSYTSEWRRRTALKMWTGWPTFPMCFHKGVLVGGANELIALLGQRRAALRPGAMRGRGGGAGLQSPALPLDSSAAHERPRRQLR